MIVLRRGAAVRLGGLRTRARCRSAGARRRLEPDRGASRPWRAVDVRSRRHQPDHATGNHHPVGDTTWPQEAAEKVARYRERQRARVTAGRAVDARRGQPRVPGAATAGGQGGFGRTRAPRTGAWSRRSAGRCSTRWWRRSRSRRRAGERRGGDEARRHRARRVQGRLGQAATVPGRPSRP